MPTSALCALALLALLHALAAGASGEGRGLIAGELRKLRGPTPEECPECVYHSLPCPGRTCTGDDGTWFDFNFVYDCGMCWEVMVANKHSMQLDVDLHCKIPSSLIFLTCDNMLQFDFDGVSLLEGCNTEASDFVREACGWQCKHGRPIARCTIDFDYNNAYGIRDNLDNCWSTQRCIGSAVQLDLGCKTEPRPSTAPDLSAREERLVAAMREHNETKQELAAVASDAPDNLRHEMEAKYLAAYLKLESAILELNVSMATQADMKVMDALLAAASDELNATREDARSDREVWDAKFALQEQGSREARMSFKAEVARQDAKLAEEQRALEAARAREKRNEVWLYLCGFGLMVMCMAMCAVLICLVRYRWKWLRLLHTAVERQDNTVYVIGRPAGSDKARDMDPLKPNVVSPQLGYVVAAKPP